MDPKKLNQMFELMAPIPEQKQRELGRLLEAERKGRPMKKLTVVAVAAALMVITCAAAVVTGIDQRILSFLNAQTAQEELISPYSVQITFYTASTLPKAIPMRHTASGFPPVICAVKAGRRFSLAAGLV